MLIRLAAAASTFGSGFLTATAIASPNGGFGPAHILSAVALAAVAGVAAARS